MNFLQADQLRPNYKRKRREYKALKVRLAKMKSGVLDSSFHELHEEAFERMDCLECANCCSTTSPIITNRDIKRISKTLKSSKNTFIKEYLRIDEDDDYVFKLTPCPFLGNDNYCSIYEDRPEACRDYPHTKRRKMHKILDLTFENSKVCPAVQGMIDKLNESI